MTERTPMAPTNPRTLLCAGLLAVIAGNLLTRLLYSDLPPLPITAAVLPGLLGAAEFVGAHLLRGRIERRRGAPPVDPLLAARALLVARASAYAGSVIAGLWVGVLVYTLSLSSTVTVTTASADSVRAGIGLVCALVLVAAGLWLEHCCRAPDDRDPDRDSRRDGPDRDRSPERPE